MQTTPPVLLVIIYLLVFTPNKSLCQDFTHYYELKDSIQYLIAINEKEKANELSVKSLTNYLAPAEDYLSGIKLNYEIKKEINDTMIANLFSICVPKIIIKHELKKNKIPFSKKWLRKLKRKYKSKKNHSGWVFRLLIRDQFARRKNSTSYIKADSINMAKIVRKYAKNPDNLNIQKMGPLASQMLEILLIHKSWKNFENTPIDLIALVKKGHISRQTLVTIVERDGLSSGFVFKINETKQTLEYASSDSLFCNDLHFSKIVNSYGILYDNETKKRFLPPLHPAYTVEEINQLRNFIFLPDMDLFLKSNPSLCLTVDLNKYCRLLQERMAMFQ